jgi:ABC-2 type transport system ATP-binding protein
MKTAAITARGLVKDYGSVRALRGVDLQVERGEVFGFLGPNGAGKSTFIRLLLHLLKPTDGSVEVLGESPLGNPALRSCLGYLPGELNMGARLTGREHLTYLAALRRGAGLDRMEELAERFGLDLDRSFRGLSKGNKQKIGLVQAFMHNPDLLILDEPTSGLDPLLQQEFLALVRESGERGATVFMSSHVLSEVEAVVGRVAIIRDGEIVDVDEVSTLRREAGQHVSFKFEGPVDLDAFSGVANFSQIKAEGNGLQGVLRGSPHELLALAARFHVVGWSAKDRDLEELFMDFYRSPASKGDSDAR